MLKRGSFELDDDVARVDLDVVWDFLSTEAYWGTWRSRVDVERQVRAAWRVVGAYDVNQQMVGFARAISDDLNFAYIADVFVLAPNRGQGLGEALLREMIDNGPGSDFRWMLHTSDAHGLYEKFGFAAPDTDVMERKSKK